MILKKLFCLSKFKNKLQNFVFEFVTIRGKITDLKRFKPKNCSKHQFDFTQYKSYQAGLMRVSKVRRLVDCCECECKNTFFQRACRRKLNAML
jgi:hypothetical protein